MPNPRSILSTMFSWLLMVEAALCTDFDTIYRRMNNVPGSLAFDQLPGLSDSVSYADSGVFLNIRSLNYSGEALIPRGDAVYKEIQTCLEESGGHADDYQFRCARLLDGMGEVRVAYGTNKQETETEQLCWAENEHLGMLVCTCNSLDRLYA